MKRTFMVFGVVMAATFVAGTFASAQEHKATKGAFGSARRHQAASGPAYKVPRGGGEYSYGGHYLGSDPDARIREQLMRDHPDTFGFPGLRE
jgi:hypothetical protein